MDLSSLEIFAEVAQTRNFATVARMRNTDPSSISRAIAALESELGTRLFHRTTRSVRLTEAGERFLRRSEVITEDLAAARAEAAEATGIPSGVIRITSSVGFSQVCLVELLPELCRTYPQIDVDLIATDSVLDLTAEGVDLAIRLAPRPEGDYVASLLRPTRYRVVASPAFVKQYHVSRPSDLSTIPALVFPLRGFRSRWLYRDDQGQVGEVSVRGRVQATSSVALLDLARSGLGVALLGDWLVERDLRGGKLVDLFPDLEFTATEFETGIWLLYQSRKFLPAKTRAVVDFLRAKLAPASNG